LNKYTEKYTQLEVRYNRAVQAIAKTAANNVSTSPLSPSMKTPMTEAEIASLEKFSLFDEYGVEGTAVLLTDDSGSNEGFAGIGPRREVVTEEELVRTAIQPLPNTLVASHPARRNSLISIFHKPA
jgi:hypothetical protein